MSATPSWLPDLIPIDGEFDSVVEKLYKVFFRDFRSNRPSFQGMQIWWDQKLSEEDRRKYEEGFWHLITKEDQRTGERLISPRRAERIAWCAAIISNHEDPAVRVWKGRKGRKGDRVFLWLHEHDYVVIFKELQMRRGPVMFLLTAYFIDGASSRRWFEKSYRAATTQNGIAAPKDGETSPSTRGG